MTFRRLIVLICLFYAAQLAAAPQLRKAGQAASSLGISSYSLSTSGNVTTAEVFDDNGLASGVLAIESGEDGDRVFHWRSSKGNELVLGWSPTGGRATLSVDGQDFVRQFDPSSKLVTSTLNAEAVFQSHARDIARIVEVTIEIEGRNGGRSAASPDSKKPTLKPATTVVQYPTPPPDPLGGGGGGSNCYGPTVRGTAVGDLARSLICARAAEDANYQCWNQYCTGCCRLSECDAACLVPGSSYLCVVAGVTGTSCASF